MLSVLHDKEDKVVAFVEYNKLTDYDELKKLVDNSDIDEDFNYCAEYIFLLKIKNRIKGTIAFKLQQYGENVKLPRFVHIIFHPDIQRNGKIGYWFLLNIENEMRKKGFNQITAHIRKDKIIMLNYAEKFGFRTWFVINELVCLYKNI